MLPRASIAVALVIARELVVVHVFQVAESLAVVPARVHAITHAITVALAVATAVKTDWQDGCCLIYSSCLYLSMLYESSGHHVHRNTGLSAGM